MGPGAGPAWGLEPPPHRAGLMPRPDEPVPYPDARLYWLRFSELAPKPADGHRHRLGERVGVLVPGLLQELLGAQVAGRGGHQRLQHGQFLRGQRERAALVPGEAGQAIELHPALLERRRRSP
jgi:hypothetical protein